MTIERRPSGLLIACDPEPLKPPMPEPRPTRITDCPDCRGPTEPGLEHESLYEIICHACHKVFAFNPGTFIRSPDDRDVNRFLSSWPASPERSTEATS